MAKPRARAPHPATEAELERAGYRGHMLAARLVLAIGSADEQAELISRARDEARTGTEAAFVVDTALAGLVVYLRTLLGRIDEIEAGEEFSTHADLRHQALTLITELEIAL